MPDAQIISPLRVRPLTEAMFTQAIRDYGLNPTCTVKDSKAARTLACGLAENAFRNPELVLGADGSMGDSQRTQCYSLVIEDMGLNVMAQELKKLHHLASLTVPNPTELIFGIHASSRKDYKTYNRNLIKRAKAERKLGLRPRDVAVELPIIRKRKTTGKETMGLARIKLPIAYLAKRLQGSKEALQRLRRHMGGADIRLADIPNGRALFKGTTRRFGSD